MNFLEQTTGTIYTAESLIPKGLPIDNLAVMRKAGYYPVSYQHQTTIDKWTQKEKPLPLEFNETDNTYYQRYKLVPLDGDTLTLNLRYLKNKAIEDVNVKTQEKILSGFYYEYEGETLFFSYNELDQINFINNFHLLSTEQLDVVKCKSYNSPNKEELTILTLDKEQFTKLYNYALANKNELLNFCEIEKSEIRQIDTIQELRTYCANNNIELLP